MQQLLFPFEELRIFYLNYFFYENLYEHVKGLATAENLPGHIAPMKIRFDSVEQDKNELEAKLQKIGFEYLSIREETKRLYEKEGLKGAFEFEFYGA